VNSSRLRRRCRLLCGLLTVIFLLVTTALCARVMTAAGEQQRLNTLCRGTIYDRGGQPLAWSDPGPDGQRHYSGGAADSALVGYRTPTYGSDGIERLFADWLRPDGGDDSHGDLYLTVDGSLQQVCYDSILSAPVAGAVVMDIRTGALLALTDTPSFQPEELERSYNEVVSRGCVFYNICTGSNITPGEMYLLPSCAAAVSAGNLTLAENLLSGNLSSIAPDDRNAVDKALRNDLLAGQVIELDCMTLRPSFEPEKDEDFAASLLGYGAARTSPVQICMYTAALARQDGSIPCPYVISRSVSREGISTEYPAGTVLSEGAFSPKAQTMLNDIFETRSTPDGDEYSFLTSTVVTGGRENLWLTACVPARQPEFALTIVMQGDRGTLTEEDILAAADTIAAAALSCQ